MSDSTLTSVRRSRSTLAFGAILLSLGGCAATKHEPVALDSTRPASAKADACQLDEAGQPKALAVGSRCLALVRADAWLSRANLKVTPGERYKITIPTDQLWFDQDRQNVPPKGEPGSWMMNLVQSWKRHDLPWFQLIAATAVCVSDVTKLCTRTRSDVLEFHPASSSPTEITIHKPGELAFYPNDAIAPWGDHLYFYNNNRGQIWIIVERLPERQ